MYFIKIDGNFVEFRFETKKDAIVYIVDYLERLNFQDPVTTLKEAEKVNTGDTDIIRTDDNTFTIFKIYHYR